MRRGSVSSWEPWARRNSANMAQAAGSRSEFMTSDLGLNDIEYKRNGGCFLSYKKTAGIVLIFIVGVVTAGVIGAYVGPWMEKPITTARALAEDDEIDGIDTPSKFTVSSSVFPSRYTIKLTPVMEETVTQVKGHVVINFVYNATEPLSELVFNAKDINVSKARLVSLRNDHTTENVHSRRRRNDPEETQNSNRTEASNVTITNEEATSPPETTINDVGAGAVLAVNSSSDDAMGVTLSMDFANETNDNSSTDDSLTLTSTPVNVVTIENVSTTHPKKVDERETEVLQKISASVSNSSSYSESSEVQKEGTEVFFKRQETDPVQGFYVIYLDTPIQRGEYSIDISYDAKVDGEYIFTNTYDLEGQRRWLLGTKMEPVGPRRLFPNFDGSNSKAIFSLTIAKPSTLSILANMPLKSSKLISNDLIVDHFEDSPPLDSKSLGFVIADLQPLTEVDTGDAKVALTLWGRIGVNGDTHFIADQIATITQNLNDFFSTPYFMPKLDVAALPGLPVDGTRSTGVILMKESIFYLTKESPEPVKEVSFKNLVKIIGGQWLGGLVSARTLTDSWITESSLIYLQYLLADKIFSTSDLLADSFGLIQHNAFEADANEISKTLESRLTLTSLEINYPEDLYEKGACLIRMLHSVVSDPGFRNGYKKFLSRWAKSSAGVSDFWNAMSEEAQWLPDRVSLGQVMDSWVSQSGFPVVTIDRNYETETAVIRQEKFRLDNSSASESKFWYIPLNYLVDGGSWSSPSKIWLTKEMEVKLENVGNKAEKKWALFNVNKTGYYRVNYDEDNWKLLSSALNLTFEKFPVATRTSLVDDVLALASAGRLGYPTALNLISYLREKETHYSPWAVALQNMVKLNNILYDTPAYANFQKFIAKFISPLFKKTTAESGETRLKLMAIKWACLVDNPECINHVKSTNKMPTHLEEIYQCAIAKSGGKSEWDSLNSKISSTEDKGTKLKLLTALPCFQVEWILQSILDDVLKAEKFDEAESLVLLHGMSNNPMAARSAFKFLRRHWNEISERFSKSYAILRAFLIASINGVIDEQDLKDFQLFKGNNYEKLRSLGHTIAVSESAARSRSSWLKSNLIPLNTWLANYMKNTS